MKPQKGLSGSSGPKRPQGFQRASVGFRSLRGPQKASKDFREPKRVLGSLENPKRRLSESPESLGRSEKI